MRSTPKQKAAGEQFLAQTGGICAPFNLELMYYIRNGIASAIGVLPG
jgi:hypothetical protein